MYGFRNGESDSGVTSSTGRFNARSRRSERDKVIEGLLARLEFNEHIDVTVGSRRIALHGPE